MFPEISVSIFRQILVRQNLSIVRRFLKILVLQNLSIVRRFLKILVRQNLSIVQRELFVKIFWIKYERYAIFPLIIFILASLLLYSYDSMTLCNFNSFSSHSCGHVHKCNATLTISYSIFVISLIYFQHCSKGKQWRHCWNTQMQISSRCYRNSWQHQTINWYYMYTIKTYLSN